METDVPKVKSQQILAPGGYLPVNRIWSRAHKFIRDCWRRTRRTGADGNDRIGARYIARTLDIDMWHMAHLLLPALTLYGK